MAERFSRSRSATGKDRHLIQRGAASRSLAAEFPGQNFRAVASERSGRMEKRNRQRPVVDLRREPADARSGFHSGQFAVRDLEQRRLFERRQCEVKRSGFRQWQRDCRSSRLTSLQRKVSRERFRFVEAKAVVPDFWKSK